jgi:KR domain
MVARGARHFIFLSRSGADKPETASLLKDLEKHSSRHELNLTIQTLRGDVANRKDVAKAIRAAKAPIKGVIQAAMVLKVGTHPASIDRNEILTAAQDSLFNTMSLEMFNAVINPKVLGTIHLHELLLDQDLDFFVMTSSVLGAIGAATQSNYSAGNAFLDHMARHRQSLGLQATSIALGMILEVGHVEAHPGMSNFHLPYAKEHS